MKKEIEIAGVKIKSRVFLAPLAGYTDYVFRNICHKFGAGLVVTELVSVAALAREIKKTYRYMKTVESEKPVSLQLFGNNEDDYKKAIEKIDTSEFAFIDINMGCPTKKVVKAGGGASILTNTQKMISILKAVKSVSKLPVSVKIRLGYTRGEGGEIERAVALKEENPAFITLHGRYASDMYRGVADWEAIAKVKEALGDFILIANGDIKTSEDAKKCFDITKAEGIMVGRAAVGCPWIFDEINTVFENYNSPAYKINNTLIKEIMTKHIKGVCELYGETKGVHFMRKFVMKYLGYMGIDKAEKIKYMNCNKIEEIETLLKKIESYD